MTTEEENAFNAGYAAGWDAAYDAGPWPLEPELTLDGALEIYRQRNDKSN